METIIEARELHRSYLLGKKSLEVLRGINLQVWKGEKLFLSGPSGAGKTTLMYTLAGLEAPQKGQVLVGGRDFYALSAKAQARYRNTEMGYVFQNFFLLPELNALENVMVPGLIGGNADRERAAELLDAVGLGDRVEHLPAELSGGEQQRVAIARALMGAPKLIFADEPTGNLDSRNGKEIIRLLFELSEKSQATLVVVTHDQELAKLGDRCMIVSDGLVAAGGDGCDS